MITTRSVSRVTPIRKTRNPVKRQMQQQQSRYRTQAVKSQKTYSRAKFKRYKARGLTEETCRKFGYVCTHHNGELVQAAIYRDAKGRPVAQKLRTKDKKFSIIGDAKAMTLFGSHLWSKVKSWSYAKAKLMQCQSARCRTISGLRYR